MLPCPAHRPRVDPQCRTALRHMTAKSWKAILPYIYELRLATGEVKCGAQLWMGWGAGVALRTMNRFLFGSWAAFRFVVPFTSLQHRRRKWDNSVSSLSAAELRYSVQGKTIDTLEEAIAHVRKNIFKKGWLLTTNMSWILLLHLPIMIWESFVDSSLHFPRITPRHSIPENVPQAQFKESLLNFWPAIPLQTISWKSGMEALACLCGDLAGNCVLWIWFRFTLKICLSRTLFPKFVFLTFHPEILS